MHVEIKYSEAAQYKSEDFNTNILSGCAAGMNLEMKRSLLWIQSAVVSGWGGVSLNFL